MYADGGTEIGAACRELLIGFTPSQPGEHQTNAIAERHNLQIEVAVRVAQHEASLPACFWCFALNAVCVIHNIAHYDEPYNGYVSPWMSKHGCDFDGYALPIGCAIFFYPSETQKKRVSKAFPSLHFGIFLGYKLGFDDVWNGEYLVEEIDTFAQVGLSYAIGAEHGPWWLQPQTTKTIRLPKCGIWFPLKDTYDRTNYTLEGNQTGTLGALVKWCRENGAVSYTHLRAHETSLHRV